ncbi:MAG: extracellular solute-binding protein [Clostridiales bacterium]|nr:extracellular solute-binding protein [Clostridiales bacterium]
MKSKIAKVILVLFVVCLFLGALYGCNDTEEKRSVNTLVIYNWEDYMDTSLPELFAEYYEAVTGQPLEIILSYFETNETMLSKMLKGDANVDLICPSEYAIERLMQYDLIQNISELKASILENNRYGVSFDNLDNIEPEVTDKIRTMFNEVGPNKQNMGDYMIPYLWGTLGILYNADVVTEEDLEYGWGILWNECGNEALHGKILVKDSVRDTYCAAVLYMLEYGLLPEGYENYSTQELINCTDDVMLKAVEEVLTRQRDVIAGYEVDFGRDDMINEIVYVDLAWSGDALYAIEEGEKLGVNLDYFVPEIGANLWFDGWVIPKNAANSLAALMFIDFLCAPEIAILNTIEIGYTTAVSKELLMENENVLAVLEENEYDPEEFFGDEHRFPVVSDKLGIMHDFGAKNDAVVAMWERAKAGNGVPMELVYVVIGAVALFLILIAAYFIYEKAKLKPKRFKFMKADR